MGTWDTKPWDNDGGADWYGILFDETGLRDKVRKTLEMDLDEGFEEIRAAASLLLFLGRTYIWPVEELDEDLELAIKRLKEVQQYDLYAEEDDFVTEIGREISLLESRIQDGPPIPDSDDNKNWWLSMR